MTSDTPTTDDRFTAEAFAQQREVLWAWYRAAEPGLTRERFDADFDAELRVMRAEEAADGQ